MSFDVATLKGSPYSGSIRCGPALSGPALGLSTPCGPALSGPAPHYQVNSALMRVIRPVRMEFGCSQVPPGPAYVLLYVRIALALSAL